MRKFLYILFFLLPAVGFSQLDTIAHLYTYGGNNNDTAEEIEATSDGGYIIVGSTSSNSSGNTDVYLLKVDSLCNKEWSVALGGANNDWGYSVKETYDKGFIIAASSNSYGNGGYDAVLMKRDSLGDYVWQKTYGGQDWDFAYSVVQTYDSGYVFCGETYNSTSGFSDVYVVKTNPSGDTLWTKTIGGSLIDKGNSIIETSDSNIVVAGLRNTVNDSTQAYVIKLDQNGVLLWDSVYGDTKYENVNEIIETTSGDYILAGATTSLSVQGDQDYLIKGINKDGIFLWDFTITNGTTPTDNEDAYVVHELANSNLLISGYSGTGSSSKNVVFFQLQSNGSWAGISSVISNSDDDYVKNVTIGNNGSIVGAGSTRSFGAGMEDVLLVRLDTIYGGQDTSMFSFIDNIPISINEELVENNIVLYPNPVHNLLSISLNSNVEMDEINIYDITGRKVLSKSTNKSLISVFSLKSGIYYVEVTYKSEKLHQAKIIKY